MRFFYIIVGVISETAAWLNKGGTALYTPFAATKDAVKGVFCKKLQRKDFNPWAKN